MEALHFGIFYQRQENCKHDKINLYIDFIHTQSIWYFCIQDFPYPLIITQITSTYVNYELLNWCHALYRKKENISICQEI